MKKALLVIACCLALGLIAVSATAGPITYGDQYFVGYYTIPEPASILNEVAYITNLIGVEAGDSEIIGGRVYNRTDSPLDGVLPPVQVSGAVKVEDPDAGLGIDVSGFTYILGKYDGKNAGALVWLVSGLDEVTLPAKWGLPGGTQTYGLSHYTLFNPTSVPDGGTTLMLLGGALIGIGLLRRRLGA